MVVCDKGREVRGRCVYSSGFVVDVGGLVKSSWFFFGDFVVKVILGF